MILPQLLWRFLKHRDDPVFYAMQAEDALRWLDHCGVPLGPGTRVLDLGCGHGVFGARLAQRGAAVTFADATNQLMPEHRQSRFIAVDLDQDVDAVARLGRGQYDLVVCSNVLEHLAHPEQWLSTAHELLADRGHLYLSWTNWLSPWGGHEFSPLHYLGASTGPALYDRLSKRKRFHQPHVNLFPTYIGSILKSIRTTSGLEVERAAPRYYTEFAFLMAIPGVREFLAWNCALLLRRKHHG